MMNANVILFPEFEPNQILTSTQLNLVREQLDVQDRSGRLRLVGTGRVCGLSFARQGDPHVLTLRAGFGVTSEGHLIEVLEPIALTHFRAYTDPDLEEGVVPERPAYRPWQGTGAAGVQIALIELLDEESAEEAGAQAQPLTSATGDGHVLVLYLERRREELRSCLVTDCDNKGTNIRLALVPLLVPKESLTPIEPCPAPPALIRIPRVGSLAGLADEVALGARFKQIVDDQVGGLDAAVAALFAKYRLQLELEGLVPVALAPKLAAAVGDEYRYDALRDIASAYNEALTAACELSEGCFGSVDFPRHLMLGEWQAGAGDYRHAFYPSVVRHVVHRDLARVRALFRRLAALLEHANFTLGAAVPALTPSHTEQHPLGERAIPFYYALGGGLPAAISQLWQPALCCTTRPVWSHRAMPPSITLDYGCASLVRVEPLVGASVPSVAEQIRVLSAQHDVEFDLVLCYFSDPFQRERVLRATLRDILEKLRETRRSFREFAWVFFDGAADESEGRALLSQIGELCLQIPILTEALQSKTSHQPLCDVGSLQAAYLRIRAQLVCAFAQVNGQLAKLSLTQARSLLKQPLIAGRSAELAAGARRTALDAVVADALAQLPDTDAASVFDELVQRIARIKSAPAETALLDAIEDARQAAWRVGAGLLRQALPHRIGVFSAELFAWCSKESATRLLAFALLRQLWERVLEGSDDTHPSVEESARLSREEARQALAALFGHVESCRLAEVYALAQAYATVRDADYSHYENLRGDVAGLEHLAGVPPGGTLVLLCSGAPEQGTVVADFALSGKLPCCCPAAFDISCVPPIAAPDYRILTATADGEPRPIDVTLPVVENDFSAAVLDVDIPESALQVRLARPFTLFGAQLTLEEGQSIRYQLAAPVPGALDQFSYELAREGEVCPGMDVGSVSVLIVRDFAQPVAVGARVAGVVLQSLEPANGADVFLTATDRPGTQLRRQSADGGAFEFTEVSAGQWALYAERTSGSRRFVSKEQLLKLESGEQILDLRLELVPSVQALTVHVLDARNGGAVIGAEVIAESRLGRQPALTDVNGTASFEGLPPAGVTLYVNALEFAPARLLDQPGRGTVNVPLRPLNVLIHPELVALVAEARHLTSKEADRLAREAFIERHVPRLELLRQLSRVPDFGGTDAHKAGAALLGDISDADRPLEELLHEYAAVVTRLNEAPNRTAASRLVALTTVALLDRLLISSSPGASRREAVEPLLRVAKSAGISVAALSQQWQSRELAERLGTSAATGGIEALLRER
jgi:hypothetical protein